MSYFPPLLFVNSAFLTPKLHVPFNILTYRVVSEILCESGRTRKKLMGLEAQFIRFLSSLTDLVAHPIMTTTVSRFS